MIKYISVPEVAEKLCCSISTVYRYIANRTIPHIKQGHRVIFIESEIDEWLLSQRVPVINELEINREM